MRFVIVVFVFMFFFFQAEDGIRDSPVTGVQTCALPIYSQIMSIVSSILRDQDHFLYSHRLQAPSLGHDHIRRTTNVRALYKWDSAEGTWTATRSEERRVGKVCRSRWSPEH